MNLLRRAGLASIAPGATSIRRECLIPSASTWENPDHDQFSFLSETQPAQTILVADDDADVRQLLVSVLVADGFAVNIASDGAQAWEALQLQHYDLLITDNEMPRMSGLQLIKRIRKAALNLPILMVSGAFSAECAHANRQLEIAAIIRKPFGLSELRRTVREILASCQTRHDATHSVPPVI